MTEDEENDEVRAKFLDELTKRFVPGMVCGPAFYADLCLMIFEVLRPRLMVTQRLVEFTKDFVRVRVELEHGNLIAARRIAEGMHERMLRGDDA